jgi:S-adenosylmethionine-dependent methyltransferase
MAPVTGTEVGRGACGKSEDARAGSAVAPAESSVEVGGDSATVTGGSAHRAIAVELAAVRRRAPDRAPRVLDVGGGSGAWAVPLAKAGCAVSVVDPSPNALAALVRRARDAGVHHLVTPVPGDVDALADVAPAAYADLVLGHGLLEVVDDVSSAIRAMTQAAAPGGAVSVLVAGRFAAVLARTLAGRLAEARAVLADPDGCFGPDDALRRRLDAAGLRRVLAADPRLRLELLQGDGVLDGWVPGAVRDAGPAAAGQIGELEERAAAEPALIDVAARLHAVARRVL